MQYVMDIERKVEKMKQESEATAHKLVQLRSEHQVLVSHRDAMRNEVAILMNRAHQREQVCTSLQFEINQRKSQLTGDRDRVLGSRADLAQPPESQANSQEAVRLAPENLVSTGAVLEGGQMERGVQYPQQMPFSAPQTIMAADPGAQPNMGVPQFPNALSGVPQGYQQGYYPTMRQNADYPMHYIQNPQMIPSRRMQVGYQNPDEYFNWDHGAEDNVMFPGLSNVSRQAAAEASDLFSDMLDSFVEETEINPAYATSQSHMMMGGMPNVMAPHNGNGIPIPQFGSPTHRGQLSG